MEQSDLISVIVPIYKVEKYLDKCIESIINQTYYNLEIILVDDGSPDDCPNICNEWAKRDKRIITFHKKNGGLSDARNFGIEHCNGKYIMFVDSDDYIKSNMVEVLYKTIIEDKSDISICDYYISKENNITVHNFSQKRFIVKENKYKYLYNEYGFVTIVAWNKLYAREIFNTIRYPKGKIHEDEFIICDLLNCANSISYVLEPLYYYVQRENSIMNKISLNRFDVVEALEKRVSFFEDKDDFINKEITQKVEFYRILELLQIIYTNQKEQVNNILVQEMLIKIQNLASVLKKNKKYSLKQKCKFIIVSINPTFYLKLVRLKHHWNR